MKNSIRTLTRFLFAGCVCLLALAPRHAVARDMTPEEYAEKVRDYFSEEQWEEGKQLLDEGLAKYDLASNLQYLMGHSDAGVTLNVYTHASYSHAASQMVSLGRTWSEVPALKTADCAAVS